MYRHPEFDPVAIAIGPLEIHWYGLTYLAAFLGGWWLARLRTGRSDSPINNEQLADLIFYLALG